MQPAARPTSTRRRELEEFDALLVIGAPNSSNSRRLVEVGRAAGCTYAQLVQRAAEIDWRALDGARAAGLTAGASAPEELVNEVIAAFAERYDLTTEPVETAVERVEFKVPRVLREPEPVVFVTELGDSSVDLSLRVWVATGDFWPVTFAFTEQAKERLTAAGVGTPFPQRVVHLVQNGG